MAAPPVFTSKVVASCFCWLIVLKLTRSVLKLRWWGEGRLLWGRVWKAVIPSVSIVFVFVPSRLKKNKFHVVPTLQVTPVTLHQVLMTSSRCLSLSISLSLSLSLSYELLTYLPFSVNRLFISNQDYTTTSGWTWTQILVTGARQWTTTPPIQPDGKYTLIGLTKAPQINMSRFQIE